MNPKTITATKLKATLLGALDEVESTGRPYLVTKHGKPIAQLVPVKNESSLLGSVTFLVDEGEFIEPFDEPWDAFSE